jgi:hypothetical protein
MSIVRAAAILAALGFGACSPDRNSNNGQSDAQQVNCMPEGAHRCLGATYQTCTAGEWQTAIDCPVACLDHLGCVQCAPEQPFCKDGDVWTCDASGNPGSIAQECTGNTTCVNGGCVDACVDAANSKSYIGCEYWAVDLDNATEVLGGASSLSSCADLFGAGVPRTLPVCYRSQGLFSYYAGLCDPPNDTCPTNYTCTTRDVCVLDAQRSPFAVVVSNPQAKDANVTVTGPGGQTIDRVVAAGQVSAIFPQMGNAIPDQSVDGTLLARRAYKISSDLPIVAYQFNPLDNADVFSNDGSLLIPRTAFDGDYYAMTYPTLDRRSGTNPQHNYHGYLAIVAWQDDTQIAVTPTAAVQASATQQSIAAGATAMFTLNAFDVLQLQAAAPGDLTGTHIVSSNSTTFGVFAGHEATGFGETTPPDTTHTSGPCCADHLEEMLFPSSTWGKSFAIARSQPRTNEPDRLRILAQKAGTTVTFTPAPSAGTCGTLGPGEFCEVRIMGDTEITASEPILIGQFLQSSMWRNNPGPFQTPQWVGTGDPSMAIAVPTEQYRKDYTILIPAQYAKSYISISAPATGGVAIDGNMVTLTTFPGGSTYRGARVEVPAGQHTITCADGCGVLVYGYDDAVSYMFAGGLDLKPIVIL